MQRDWYATVDEIMHAYVRDVKGPKADEFRNRLVKTLARWEELQIYTPKLKQWKSLALMETKPRRALMRLPRTEAERLAEIPDQLQQFPPPPTHQLIQLSRINCPFVYERDNFRTLYDKKQHWRYTGIAFIHILGQSFGVGQEITLSACIFFQRLFDRGIYMQERFKYAAACLFLSAKAASKRMKLVRMVKTMHEILELPLLYGDEEVLELERMQLLYYEMEVLKGIDFELATESPFKRLRQTLEQMPEKFRRDVDDTAQQVLEDLFWLPLCLSTRPVFLAEAAAYIACRNKDRIFSFRWCREDTDGQLLTEKAAKDILKEYRHLMTWKKDQQRHFNDLVRSSPSASSEDLQKQFATQRGGLRIDVSMIPIKSEFTKKGENESKEVLETYIPETTIEDRTSRNRNRDDRNRKRDCSPRRRESRSRSRIESSRRSDYDRRDRDRSRDRYDDRSRDRYESKSHSSRSDRRSSSRKRRDDDSRIEIKREGVKDFTRAQTSSSSDKKRSSRTDESSRSHRERDRSKSSSRKRKYTRSSSKSPSRDHHRTTSSRGTTKSSTSSNKRRRSVSRERL